MLWYCHTIHVFDTLQYGTSSPWHIYYCRHRKLSVVTLPRGLWPLHTGFFPRYFCAGLAYSRWGVAHWVVPRSVWKCPQSNLSSRVHSGRVFPQPELYDVSCGSPTHHPAGADKTSLDGKSLPSAPLRKLSIFPAIRLAIGGTVNTAFLLVSSLLSTQKAW